MYACVCTNVHACIHSHAHTRTHTHARTHAHTHTHTYIHTYIHTCTHTHTHTCIHLKLSSGPPCNQQQITTVEDVAGRWTSFGQSLCLVVPGLRQLTDLVSSAEWKWFFYVKYCEWWVWWTGGGFVPDAAAGCWGNERRVWTAGSHDQPHHDHPSDLHAEHPADWVSDGGRTRRQNILQTGWVMEVELEGRTSCRLGEWWR